MDTLSSAGSAPNPSYLHRAGATERVLGWTAVLYGLTILNPWTQVFDYRVYRPMAEHGSEVFWGAVIAGIGFSQLLGLKWRQRGVRELAAWFSAILWTTMGWLFFLGVISDTPLSVGSVFRAWTHPGVALYLLWGIFQADVAFRLRRQKCSSPQK